MFAYLKIFQPKMKIFSIFAVVTTSKGRKMYNDYIIADHRIRIVGPVSDLLSAGLRGFAPFVTQTDGEPMATILTGETATPQAEGMTQLTQFDFDEGHAVCTFSRSADEYMLTIEAEGVEPFVVWCRRDCLSQISTNAQVGVNPSFLRFGLWFAVNLAFASHLTTAVHTSVIVCHDEAVMFLGESGTGKSTHTRLWRETIEGATLLNDDSPFIGIKEGRVTAYGSPWSGKTPCYKNESYPLRAIVRLSQAPHNAMRRLRGAQAMGALLPSLPPAFAFDERLEEAMIAVLSTVLRSVPVYHLECLPNADAAQLSHDTVFGL